MTTNETSSKPFGDVIARYTRAQAIEDGFHRRDRNREGSGNQLPHRPDGNRLGMLRHRARKSLLAGRKRPTMGCSHDAPLRHYR